ncbi:hypothetical protein MMC22_001448 [Lobaria immixta]|nr:hypothetical protein [Lobaria immixta]
MRGKRGQAKKDRSGTMKITTVLAFLASMTAVVDAQACVPLADSTECPAFNASSISTGPELTSSFPFLAFVSNTQQFDEQLKMYITSGYVQLKYQQLLGCNNVNLRNTSNLYARYTTSVICNAIVQNSIGPCALSSTDSRPLCAESCAQQAMSEEQIAINDRLCGAPNSGYLDQIRADFTNCALPSDSLTMGCITGEQNEPAECGYSANLQGLCGYCASSSPNSTDSCCVTSNVTSRCADVTLPSIFSVPPLFPSSTSSISPSATATATNSSSAPNSTSQPKHGGLSGGQIAGIVVGSVLGAAALVGLLLLLCLCLRRRRRGSQTSVFNQPTPQRKLEPGMVFSPRNPSQTAQIGNDGPQEGRVARMSALEPTSSDSRLHGTTVTAGPSRRAFGDNSDSGAYGDTPESRGGTAPPVTGKRNGSLSSQSVLGGLDDPSSPQSGSGGQYSSPEGLASAQSEQLPFFRDYYSQDEIHPGDKVATLWAYEPRAADEFELERGDMLKVVGIWDDGWATGVRLDDRAENYDGKNKIQRDSGVSNGSGRKGESPPLSGEIKAFPLVCVCLPEHWKKTIEGDSDDSGPSPSFGP